jgi:ATP-dependent exoDNAse (exonuclease V) alpha subunit
MKSLDIDTFLQEGRIDPFDVDVGVAAGAPWLGVYLSKALALGHLEVKINLVSDCANSLKYFPYLLPHLARVENEPDLATTFADQDGEPLDEERVQALLEAFCHEKTSSKLIVNGDAIALPYGLQLRQKILEELMRISLAVAHFPVKKVKFLDLSPEQQAALDSFSEKTVGVLTGGPGTGKTYTAGQYIKMLQESKKELRVGLFAPTGRAVQNLENAIVAEGAEGKTIHRALLTDGPLAYHVIIIDESSMVGSLLFWRFLRKIHSGTRVLFLGDKDQLPPIDAGQPFFELVQEHERLPIAYQALTCCQRTKASTLLKLASSIRDGDGSVLSSVRDYCTDDFEWIDISSMQVDEIIGMIAQKSHWSSTQAQSAQEAKEGLSRSIVLTPHAVGPLGSAHCNEELTKFFGHKYVPVVAGKNQYDLQVMNGDLGVLDTRTDRITFESQIIPAVLLMKMDLAYALTVHKCQGSEFDQVILVLPPKVQIDRRLLYTAVTRAKRKLIIFYSKNNQ